MWRKISIWKINFNLVIQKSKLKRNRQDEIVCINFDQMVMVGSSSFIMAKHSLAPSILASNRKMILVNRNLAHD